MKTQFIFLAVVLLLLGCKPNTDNNAIIVHENNRYAADGKLRVLNPNVPFDTFEFYNQNGDTITNETLKGKVYIADFFFTRCPSICVPMAVQMKRIYDKYENDDRVLLLSHSIDTRGDSIPVLKAYEQKLGVAANKWHFVTGKTKDIYKMAKQYMVYAEEKEDAPGGYEHNGMFALVDKQGQIRSFCTDGTKDWVVDQFIEDIDKLLNEE